MKIILASQSPRRKQLLELAEISFDVVVADVNEDIDSSKSISEVAIDIALRKANKVYSENPHACIIAADTIVVTEDNEILGKPTSKENAIEIISKLNNKSHKVITGVVIKSNNFEERFYEQTIIYFNNLTPHEIESYVDKNKPYDKAGAYAIQEWIGAVGISKIEGDYYNVMGLPINRVYKILKHYLK